MCACVFHFSHIPQNLWERFIEIIISIADFLLKKKVEEEPIADRLTPNILRVRIDRNIARPKFSPDAIRGLPAL